MIAPRPWDDQCFCIKMLPRTNSGDPRGASAVRSRPAGDALLKILGPVLSICAALAICLGTGEAWPAAEAKRVLVLFETESNLPAAVIAGAALRKALLSKPSDLVDFDEFLDLDRFPEPAHRALMARFLREKYAGTPVDVVIAAGSQALDFMLEHRGDLFPDASDRKSTRLNSSH